MPPHEDDPLSYSYYRRPELRAVWEAAAVLESDEERRRYLRLVIDYDRWNGLTRRLRSDDEWYEFTPDSVRIVLSGVADPEGQRAFEEAGRRFRERVREMLRSFEGAARDGLEEGARVPEAAASSASDETTAGASSGEGGRLAWMESQNLFAAWVHLSYKAFMATTPSAKRSADKEKLVVEALSSMFEAVDKHGVAPINPKSVYGNGLKDGTPERVLQIMEATLDRLRKAQEE